MQLTEKHREYWSKNLRITGILLFIWFLVTFASAISPVTSRSISSGGRSRSTWRRRDR